MILLLDAFALALVGTAAIVAAFTLEGQSPLQGWAVACFVTSALVVALLSINHEPSRPRDGFRRYPLRGDRRRGVESSR
jgi:hypothetical protein